MEQKSELILWLPLKKLFDHAYTDSEWHNTVKHFLRPQETDWALQATANQHSY